MNLTEGAPPFRPRAPLRVESNDRVERWVWWLRDLAMLLWLAVCVVAMPAFAWTFWILVGTIRKILELPGYPTPSTALFLGTIASWCWMVLGYQAVEVAVGRRAFRRVSPDSFRVRFRPSDRRLRAPHDTGAVRLGADALEFRGLRWDVWIGREDILRGGAAVSEFRSPLRWGPDRVCVPVRTPDSRVCFLLEDGSGFANALREWLQTDRPSGVDAVDKAAPGG